MSGDGGGQAGAQREQARYVHRLRALLHRGAEQHVVDLATLQAGALDRGADRMRTERRGKRVVERTAPGFGQRGAGGGNDESEEHTSELQSLMRISYAVFCLNKKKKKDQPLPTTHTKKIRPQPPRKPHTTIATP